MRGGVIPVIAWFALNGVLFIVHLLMTGHEQADVPADGLAAFALGILIVWVLAFLAESRQTLRRGAPELDGRPEAVPTASLGAILVAFSFVACGFGLVFGTFLVLIAAGAFVGGLFVLVRELRDERRARRSWRQKVSSR